MDCSCFQYQLFLAHKIGADLAMEFMILAGCTGLESCRALTPAEIKKAAADAGKNVAHPIKLVLEPGFGPVVDGNYISGTSQNSQNQ